MEVSNAFVCLMGVGTVFVGLICIIILTWLLGKICGSVAKEETAPAAPAQAAPVATEEIPNRPEFIAAVAAAIAEDMGTDISAIRIHSVKKI